MKNIAQSLVAPRIAEADVCAMTKVKHAPIVRLNAYRMFVGTNYLISIAYVFAIIGNVYRNSPIALVCTMQRCVVDVLPIDRVSKFGRLISLGGVVNIEYKCFQRM